MCSPVGEVTARRVSAKLVRLHKLHKASRRDLRLQLKCLCVCGGQMFCDTAERRAPIALACRQTHRIIHVCDCPTCSHRQLGVEMLPVSGFADPDLLSFSAARDIRARPLPCATGRRAMLRPGSARLPLQAPHKCCLSLSTCLVAGTHKTFQLHFKACTIADRTGANGTLWRSAWIYSTGEKRR